MMRLPKKDIIATSAVALAVVLYVLWLADATVLGMSSTRVTGLAVLVLGFVASAVAVVPSFDQLIHGNRLYLAATSVLGVAALAAGVVMLLMKRHGPCLAGGRLGDAVGDRHVAPRRTGQDRATHLP